MRRRLRRFAAVGAIVTALDVAVLLALRLGAGLPVIVADACSVAVAATVSYLLHRAITFAGDPHLRWVDRTGLFVFIAGLAGAVDVIAIRLVVIAAGSTTASALLVAKACSLAVAGVLRVALYRGWLFRQVRQEQARR